MDSPLIEWEQIVGTFIGQPLNGESREPPTAELVIYGAAEALLVRACSPSATLARPVNADDRSGRPVQWKLEASARLPLAMIPAVAVLNVARERRALSEPRTRIRLVCDRMSADAAWLWLAVLVFVGVSFWWLAEDNRIPIWDAASHIMFAFVDGSALAQAKLSLPFTVYTTYPPLVHLVGGVSDVLLGLHPMAMTMASNLVFVPLLAFGCYGVGNIVGGPRAGLLAGLFGLGTPMFVSMMHSFMVDTPQAAMVAVAVWAVLASRRFARLGPSVLAGVICGLAMLTKETSVVFLAGLLVAVLVRGGWRNWQGLIGFAVALGVVAGPWYVYHWRDLTQTYSQIGQLYVNSLQSPPRWSIRNFGWYFWNLVNEQALLPFTLAMLAGIAVAVRRCIRDRFTSESVLPELLAGLAVSYVGMTYLTHKDPRYTLPALVYVSVLGTFWIATRAPGRTRTLLTGGIIAIAVINFVGMSSRARRHAADHARPPWSTEQLPLYVEPDAL